MQLLRRLSSIVPRSSRTVPGWFRVLSVPLVAGLVVLGVWVTGGRLTDDEVLAKVATAAWLLIAGGAAVVSGARWRALALPVAGTFAVTAAAVGGFLVWSSTVDRTVVEAVPTVTDTAAQKPRDATATTTRPRDDDPVLLARGRFRSGEHRTSGTASALRLPSGKHVVILDDLDTSPGPDLRVYLTPDAGGDFAGAVDLGRLRGNKGTQQYAVPASIDASHYQAVVVWCRAFSVAFGTAALTSPA